MRLPLPAPVGISVPPMPRVPASLQRGRGQGRGRPQGSKNRGPPSLHQNAVKARKCRKERAHNNSSERRCSLVRVLGRSRTCVGCLNVLLMRAPAEIHCKYTIHARCVGSDAHDLLRSTVSLGLGLGLGLGSESVQAVVQLLREWSGLGRNQMEESAVRRHERSVNALGSSG